MMLLYGFILGLVCSWLYLLIVRKIRDETIVKLRNPQKLQWVVQDDITDVKNVTVQIRGRKK